MELITNIVLMFIILIIIVSFIILIVKTKREDMGCNFDCEHCPFPKCSQQDKDNIKRLQEMEINNDLYNR